MGIIDNGYGVMNSISDPFNDYNGKISIEYRGSSSQTFPKKPPATLLPLNLSVCLQAPPVNCQLGLQSEAKSPRTQKSCLISAGKQ